ncbi:receptor-like protein 12 [Solanum tuberosum]|uniref:receptor-like protein 12 n=1 Tax=Solanum tuberosum TaxID=4113 RepID=UPI00073A1671|nr:PREDICTED: receptor-like protein 12 [Solanum tuberosum]
MGKRNNPRGFLITWSLLLLETAFGLTSREVSKTLCIEKGRDALLEFKRGLNDDFGRLSTWGDKKECYKWNGIECDKRTGHVIVLDLHSEVTCPGHACFAPILTVKDLVWLSHLSSLEFLRLGGNYFQASNWFREITKVPLLKELDLSVCGLSKFVLSPADLANSSLISLSILHLCCNDFSTSSVYNWLFNFSTSLTSIDLSHNQLIRQIDDRFGSLMYLEHLNLANNFEVKDGVPSSFGSLMYLEHLNLDMSNTQTYQWLPELFLRLTMSHFNPLSSILNQNKLEGPNYVDWKRNLDIVLTYEDFKDVLVEECLIKPVDAIDEEIKANEK